MSFEYAKLGIEYEVISYLLKPIGMADLTAALRMIEQNYMDPELLLAAVSEQLHVSPNYLSANMKKYAGDTFINLLIKTRMESAWKLIEGTAYDLDRWIDTAITIVTRDNMFTQESQKALFPFV